MDICEKKSCVGCGMCIDACPFQAISMRHDKHGFLYPEVDEQKCTKCEICKKKCPANAGKVSTNVIQEIYAAWNKRLRIRRRSTSGGVFTVIANYILDNGGVVAGVKWNRAFSAEHTIIDRKENLYLLNGSKYVQSNTNSIYKAVKDNLEAGKPVLFSGTPCQNHALLSYLGKRYEKLLLVDLVCHGVPSEGVFSRYLDERTENGKRKIVNICLRHKNPFWDFCNVTIKFKKGGRYSVPTVDDSYFSLFNVGFSLRPSCSECRYTNQNRCGDITLADFWGFQAHSLKTTGYLSGVSLILVNSDSGKAVLQKVKNFLYIESASLDAALRSNKSLTMPYKVPENDSAAFWQDYENGMSVDALCKKYITSPFKKPVLWRRLLSCVRWMLKK